MVGDCIIGKMTWQEGDWERDGSVIGLGSVMELRLAVKWRTRLVNVG